MNQSHHRQSVSAWIDGDQPARADDRQPDSPQPDSLPTGEIATELAVHGLIQELANRDAIQEEQRIAAVLDAIESSTMELPSPVPRTTQALVALAAGILLVAGIGAWLLTEDRQRPKLAQQAPVDSPEFVSVAQVVDADFPTHSELNVGDRLSARTIALNAGFVRLTFDDGVQVTLQGPAEYELVAAGKTRLKAGLLTAHVPAGAEGFTVDTPDAEVVDLGTAFGIDLSEAGVSHVSVFEGKVEVSAATSADKQQLTEGEAVRVKLGEAIESIDFDPERFSKVWPVSSGIERSTDSFRFVPPWPRQIKQIRSDHDIFILPEGRPVTLTSPLPVNATEPGQYATEESLIVADIPSGARIRSFLLMCHPEKAGPLAIKPVSGSITFDSPILGLIIRHEEIQASARRFLRRGPRLIQPEQQLELNAENDRDVITLSEDRRTLTLDLKVRTRFGEMIRVIVDATNNNQSRRTP